MVSIIGAAALHCLRMRSRYAVANWKMNLPPEGIDAYVQRLPSGGDSVRIVLAPPFPYLRYAADRAGVAIAAQNCADQRQGAFTGEVSPTMLRDCGATFVIVGHSERRTLFGESDALIARKLSLAIEVGLTPILCVGENQKVRDAGEAAIFVANQIRSAAVPALGDATVIVAYEPIWAVGTGRNATGAAVAEMVGEIRQSLSRFWPKKYAQTTSILYGGSVTPENIDDLGSNGNIEGYLVGGASLDSAKFGAICDGVSRLRTA
jgi:triosephosphate isomerase (TIM)